MVFLWDIAKMKIWIKGPEISKKVRLGDVRKCFLKKLGAFKYGKWNQIFDLFLKFHDKYGRLCLSMLKNLVLWKKN